MDWVVLELLQPDCKAGKGFLILSKTPDTSPVHAAQEVLVNKCDFTVSKEVQVLTKPLQVPR